MGPAAPTLAAPGGPRFKYGEAELSARWQSHHEQLQRILADQECKVVEDKTFLAMSRLEKLFSTRSASLPASFRLLQSDSLIKSTSYVQEVGTSGVASLDEANPMPHSPVVAVSPTSE